MSRSFETQLDGIPVRVVHRPGMKTIRIKVDDAGVCVVSAAPYISAEEMLSYVREKHDWIARHRAERIGSPSYLAAHASKKEIESWRSVVKACVPPLVEEWERILGVKVGMLAYRNMTSKWGSCQPSTGRVCINIRLALYPPECLEYVVVHELCHLLQANHGPKFWGLMDKVMPDWRERQAKLRG